MSTWKKILTEDDGNLATTNLTQTGNTDRTYTLANDNNSSLKISTHFGTGIKIEDTGGIDHVSITTVDGCRFFDTNDESGGKIQLREGTDTGDNYVQIQCPDDLDNTQAYTFPTNYPSSNGQVLSSTTTGQWSWVDPGGTSIDNYAENRVLTAGNSSTNIDAESLLTYNTHTITQGGSSNNPTFQLLQNTGVIHCKSNGSKPSGFMMDATNALGDTGLNAQGTLSVGSNNGTHIVVHFASVNLVTASLYTFYDNSGAALQLARANAQATAIGFIGYYAQDTTTSEASAVLMTEGIIVVPNASITGTFTEGGILYLDDQNAGKFTFTIPDTSGFFVRHMGYALYQQGTNTVVYFKPSTDFIELA
tara:strand:- start:90 stop:1178 length:1089 start_codon:yes stop_codon:yes gene_type:complete